MRPLDPVTSNVFNFLDPCKTKFVGDESTFCVGHTTGRREAATTIALNPNGFVFRDSAPKTRYQRSLGQRGLALLVNKTGRMPKLLRY